MHVRLGDPVAVRQSLRTGGMAFQMSSEGRSSRTIGRKRDGAAAVEFALLAPFMFLLILAMIEFGWAMRSEVLLAHAARDASRVGSLAGKATSDITATVSNDLSSSGMTGGTVTVLVNGAVADANTAVTGDAVTVTISLPVNGNSWLPSGLFLGGGHLSNTVVMRRE